VQLPEVRLDRCLTRLNEASIPKPEALARVRVILYPKITIAFIVKKWITLLSVDCRMSVGSTSLTPHDSKNFSPPDGASQ
jgi:hypothetical protein